MNIFPLIYVIYNFYSDFKYYPNISYSQRISTRSHPSLEHFGFFYLQQLNDILFHDIY